MSIVTSSETWIEVQKWAKAEIEKRMNGLAAFPQPPGQSDYLRGQIYALQDLLLLPTGNKKPDVPAAPDYHA